MTKSDFRARWISCRCRHEMVYAEVPPPKGLDRDAPDRDVLRPGRGTRPAPQEQASVPSGRSKQGTFNGQRPFGVILDRSHAVEGRALSTGPVTSPGWAAAQRVAVLAGGADRLSRQYSEVPVSLRTWAQNAVRWRSTAPSVAPHHTNAQITDWCPAALSALRAASSRVAIACRSARRRQGRCRVLCWPVHEFEVPALMVDTRADG